MILPAALYILIFCYGPMYGLQLAFKDYDFSKGITGGDWAGFTYFQKYFDSPLFWPTIRNTFTIAFFSLICGFPVPIILAIAINSIKSQRWKRTVQTTVYLPYFISTVVLVAILQILLSTTTGLVSNALKAIGLIGEKANLLGDPGSFVPVYVISGICKVPVGTALYLLPLWLLWMANCMTQPRWMAPIVGSRFGMWNCPLSCPPLSFCSL